MKAKTRACGSEDAGNSSVHEQQGNQTMGASGALIVQPVRRVNKIMPEIVLAFGIDITGSSGQHADRIRRIVEQIARPIGAKARAVRVYLQAHGDQDYGQFPTLLTNGGTIEEAIADLARVTFGGGGDDEEWHTTAVSELVKVVPWPSDPRKGRSALVLFMTDDTKPDLDGMTPQRLGEEIKRRGILPYLVCNRLPFAEELADAAGGLLFEITREPEPAELQRIAIQLCASILATVGAGATRPMTVPINPERKPE